MSAIHATAARDLVRGAVLGRALQRGRSARPRRAAGVGAFVVWLTARRREEVTLLAVAAAAWAGWIAISVATGAATPWGEGPATGGGHRHPPPGLESPLAPTGADAIPAIASAGASPSSASVLVALAMWALMAAGMMLPTVLPAARYVAEVSRPARRGWMVATFTLTYLTMWMALGALIVAVDAASGPPTRAALVAAIVAAALWELTPIKRRALARCCRTTPIRLRGASAYRSAAAFGFRNGGACLFACGPAMAVLALAGHPLAATTVVAALLTGEKVWRRGERLRVWACAGGLLLAAVAVGA
ncbi:DUF2182 domain-containing protein [Agromyces sp. Soil535]|uniref:copper chaperone n=1 Tax=Agromyces sp. Soil535 TaxID=1736390 RepID=UPI0006F69DAE|nr:DUF2182 domain-containing protein [Agromyces sp. Soil535]KRE21864.1 hypothetical protein ASG80_12340 [Agromyces sp. Soil535]